MATYQVLFPQVLTAEHHGLHHQHAGNTAHSNNHQQRLDPNLKIHIILPDYITRYVTWDK